MSANHNRNENDNDAKAATPDEANQGSGKVANDHNSEGDKAATQLHQGRRTPESRHDRDSHLGSGNQSQSRQGAAGSGGGKGRGAG